MDEKASSKLSFLHIKIMLISGISFFTDAYDLFVIGAVLILIKGVFQTSAFGIGLLASSALFGAVLGPTLFGYLGDKLGRKYTYWVTVSILAIAAIGSSLSQSVIELVLWRFLLGIGIGGDYPLSSTIVAEYANRDDRGKLIASTFSMQGFGIITAILLSLVLIYGGVPNALAWRLLLGFGAIPSLIGIPLRKKMDETPLYKRLEESRKVEKSPRLNEFIKRNPSVLLGTSLSWFLVDITYYGTGIFTPYITSLIGFSGTLAPIEASALLLLAFAVPGYWIAVALIDRQGRRSMQAIGFLVTSIAFIVIFLFGKIMLASIPLLFFAIYGLSFLFTNYGPNTTTYVYPVELYPTAFRARGHGIAATAGKLGATISALLFPLLISSIGKFSLLGMLGIVSFAGFIVTIALMPETKKRELSLTSKEYELNLVNKELADDIRDLMSHIKAGTSILRESFSTRSFDPEELFSRVKEQEHDADIAVRHIFEKITSISVNPLIFSDVSHLARRLDDIIDTEEAIASRCKVYSIAKADKYMERLSEILGECVESVSASLKELSTIEEARSMNGINAVYAQISKQENQADNVLRDSLENVMKKEPHLLIKYKEIYELLEGATDRTVDAVEIVEDIALRYIYRS